MQRITLYPGFIKQSQGFHLSHLLVHCIKSVSISRDIVLSSPTAVTSWCKLKPIQEDSPVARLQTRGSVLSRLPISGHFYYPKYTTRLHYAQSGNTQHASFKNDTSQTCWQHLSILANASKKLVV